MATKTLLPNQHVPLHWLYGHNDCCLCRVEIERDTSYRANLDLEVENVKLQEKIKIMQKRIEDLEGEIDDWERYGYKK